MLKKYIGEFTKIDARYGPYADIPLTFPGALAKEILLLKETIRYYKIGLEKYPHEDRKFLAGVARRCAWTVTAPEAVRRFKEVQTLEDIYNLPSND